MLKARFSIVLVSLFSLPAVLDAQIFRWDTGEIIPGTENITPAPSVDLRLLDLSFADLVAQDLTRGDLRSSDLVNARFVDATLARARFQGADLRGADFRNADLMGAGFTDAEILAANLSGATTGGFAQEQLYSTRSYQAGRVLEVDLSDNDLRGWDFSGRDFTRSSFRNSDVRDADFRGANLTRVSFYEGRVMGADFSDAVIQGAGFSAGPDGLTEEQLRSTASYQQRDLRNVALLGDISGWDLSNQDLTGAGFSGFSGSNLTEAVLSNANVSRADFFGARLSDANLRGSYSLPEEPQGPYFQFAVLTDADLRETTYYLPGFRGADLTGARLNHATFTNALFTEATLDGADLSDASLRDSEFRGASLIGVDFRRSDLSGSNFDGAELADANFMGAIIAGTDLRYATSRGFSRGDLYSTESYQARDLSGILFSDNDLTGWNFSGQDLTNALFYDANLKDTVFEDAVIAAVALVDATSRGFTAAQLESTASYKSHDLRGVDLALNDLAGWDFSGQDLTGASFNEAILVESIFEGAIVSGAQFGRTTSRGFTQEMLYSTESYRSRDVSGISLGDNEMVGWDFSGLNLTGANFRSTDVTDASFRDTDLSGADLRGASLRNADFGLANLTGTMLSPLVEGADFTDATIAGTRFARGLTPEQLYSTASYRARDLRGIHFGSQDISGWDLSGQDLGGATLAFTTLNDTEFTDARIEMADFGASTSRGFTAVQLYSTQSYRLGELRGIRLVGSDISGWDFTGQNLESASFANSTAHATDFRGADLTDASFREAALEGADFTDAIVNGTDFGKTTSSGFTAEQLYDTASYKARDLSDAHLGQNDLTGWNFAGQNLTGASFAQDFPATESAILTDANFADSIIAGADFRYAVSNGFTPEQLYATASYKARDLRGVQLGWNDLSRWDFSGQFLVEAGFGAANLDFTDFSFADLRNAGVFLGHLTTSRNAIRFDGEVRGLHLADSEELVIRDYEFGVTAVDEMHLSDGSALEFVLADQEWQSTLTVDPDVTPSLGGTLRVRFADEADPAALVGATFDLFNWSGELAADNRFDGIDVPHGDFGWNLRELYTTGEIALTAAGLGDFNANGLVEQGDLDLVLLAWGTAAADVPDFWINDLPSTFVGQAELDAVLMNWGTWIGPHPARTLPRPTAIPEPTGLAIAVLLAAACQLILPRNSRGATRLRR